MKSVKIKIFKKMNWRKIWYALCWFALGFIDQRRGSAPGEVQMAAANLTGVVIAGMLIPSLNKMKFKEKIYKYWSILAFLGGIALGIWGWENWDYKGQWYTAILNAVIWGYLVIYIVRERKILHVREKARRPIFVIVVVMFLQMFFSVHEGISPLWMLMVLGGFFLIGIRAEDRDDFFEGMLNGIILWFFIQQTIAFGFRPYDYLRYRGLYSGETQNGLFYMIAYCAFMLKWIWLKERERSKVLSGICLLMSAGCVSFILYTGSRAPIVGVVIVSAVIYIWYDIVHRKSFYKLFVHCMLFTACMVLTFPIVYASIRYFPVILHHPIWFEGEYSEQESVRSFDPWDSERYISFERAVDDSVGRIFSAIGINLRKWRTRNVSGIVGIKAYAMEMEEPGDTPENPFMLPGVDLESAMGAREVIYVYYWKHLNWVGHSKVEPGFFLTKKVYIGHAHNLFLQIAYDYGILGGILFMGLYFIKLFQAFRWGRDNCLVAMTCTTFLLAILGFGFFEMVVLPGQITVALIGILFCVLGFRKCTV